MKWVHWPVERGGGGWGGGRVEVGRKSGKSAGKEGGEQKGERKEEWKEERKEEWKEERKEDVYHTRVVNRVVCQMTIHGCAAKMTII
jgi:hypothetical protein